MQDCLFCKITAGEIPSKKAYEDDDVLGFYDINPQAPVHIVFIPKKHVMSCLNDVTEDNAVVIGKVMIAIKKCAAELGLDEKGYRVINNCGKDAAQSVMHLHFHLLGGKPLGEKIV